MNGANAVAVLGAGSFGTALAVNLATAGNPVSLWARDPEHARQIKRSAFNHKYLAQVKLPDAVRVEDSLQSALTGASWVLLAVPSAAFGSIVKRVAQLSQTTPRIAWVCKGFEPHTGRLLHEVALQELGDSAPLAVLSGPTFALELAQGLPSALTVAGTRDDFVHQIVAQLHSEALRAYSSTDLIGVQVGGSVKNVMAIAAGLCDGLGFGANARAALITRALAEIRRLGIALGARAETFSGLAGLGDLVLTCSDDQSRNRRFGLALAREGSPQGALAAVGALVEGARNAEEVVRLAAKTGVEMPIAEQVHRIVSGIASPQTAARELLLRAPKSETE